MVHHKDGVKSIYEIEGSNERFYPEPGDTKISVIIHSVTDADIKRNLKKLSGFQGKKVFLKGFRFMLSGIDDKGIDDSNIKNKFVKLGLVDAKFNLTKAGITFIRKNLAEKMAALDGDLAIIETKTEKKLVKFVI